MFNDLFNSMNDGLSSEDKARIIRIERTQEKHEKAIRKLNDLMKEAIKRIEAGEH